MRISLTLFAASLLITPPVTAAPRTHTIVIDSMKFGPVPPAIRAGDRIVWVNMDMFRHTATSRSGGFDLDLPPGTRKTILLEKAGEFGVTCRYHPGMRTALKVKP